MQQVSRHELQLRTEYRQLYDKLHGQPYHSEKYIDIVRKIHAKRDEIENERRARYRRAKAVREINNKAASVATKLSIIAVGIFLLYLAYTFLK